VAASSSSINAIVFVGRVRHSIIPIVHRGSLLFALGNALLGFAAMAVLLSAIGGTSLDEFLALAAGEPVRVAVLSVVLPVCFVIALMELRRGGTFYPVARWMVALIPAIAFEALFAPMALHNLDVSRNPFEFLGSYLVLVGGATLILATVLRFGPATRVPFGDRGRQAAAGAAVILIALPLALWFARDRTGDAGMAGGQPEPTRKSGDGVVMRSIAQGALALPSGTLSVAFVEVRQGPGETAEDSHTAGFVYVVDGRPGLSISGSAAQTPEANAAAFVPTGTKHSHVNATTSAATWYWVSVRPTGESGAPPSPAQRRTLYETAELPSLPPGQYSDVLMRVTLETGASTLRYRTGGVDALLVQSGSVSVESGVGTKTLRAGEGLFVLERTPIKVSNVGAENASFLAFFLVPQGSEPLTEMPTQ